MRAKSKETIERENLVCDICKALDSIRGKSIIGHSESVNLFTLYNKYYGTNEKQYGCDLCVIRIINSLQTICENNKKQ